MTDYTAVALAARSRVRGLLLATRCHHAAIDARSRVGAFLAR